MQRNNKIYQFLGLASRARKVVTGDSLIEGIRKHEVHYVCIASDASQNSIKKVIDKCTFYHVDYVMIGTIEELSVAIGKYNRIAIGLTDIGFTKKIKEMIGG